MNNGKHRKNLFGSGSISVISLALVFMLSANTAHGARMEITWQNMFNNVLAYEDAMRASGVHNFNRIQDANDMNADAIAYDRDARAFIDDYLNRRGSRDAYIIERDFSSFHDTRLRELEQKWKRSPYLVECATKMAVYVRDNNIARMKSVIAADPRHTMAVAKTDDANTSRFYSAPEEKEIISLVERATVFIVAVDTTKNTASVGSGFFVAPGVILTNRHVVDDKNLAVYIFSKALGRPAQASVVGISDRKERDYALLRLDRIVSGFPPHLAFNTDAKPADKVIAWGFPMLAVKNDPKFQAMMQGDMRSAPDVVFSEGVITTLQNADPPFFLHSATMDKGNSGGPLVNTKGQALGINTSIFTGAGHRQSGAAIAASDIVKFIREHGVSPDLAR